MTDRRAKAMDRRTARGASKKKTVARAAKRAAPADASKRATSSRKLALTSKTEWTARAMAERAGRVQRVLDELYPSPRCELDYDTPFQLLIAVILSAQTTDKRVNSVTPELFRRFPDAASLAKANLFELREILRSIGFFRAKARAIRETAKLIVKRHGGQVPQTMRALIELKGVARKTANVVLGEAFDVAEGIAVDTHVARVSTRLGLTRAKTVRGIERDLMALIPRERWAKDHLRLVLFGRYRCLARAPKCAGCPLREGCLAPEAAQR